MMKTGWPKLSSQGQNWMVRNDVYVSEAIELSAAKRPKKSRAEYYRVRYNRKIPPSGDEEE